MAAAAGAWVGSIDDGRRGRRRPHVRRGGRPAVRARRLGPARPAAAGLTPGGTDFVTAAEPENLDVPDAGRHPSHLRADADAAHSNVSRLLPDGRSVVYAVDAADGSSDLYLMTLTIGNGRFDGATARRPREPVRDELVARRNTAARSIGHGARRQLYRYDFATEDLQPFLENAYNPAWSPDGRSVASRASPRTTPPTWTCSSRADGPTAGSSSTRATTTLPRLGAGGEPARVRQRGPGGISTSSW